MPAQDLHVYTPCQLVAQAGWGGTATGLSAHNNKVHVHGIRNFMCMIMNSRNRQAHGTHLVYVLDGVEEKVIFGERHAHVSLRVMLGLETRVF